ncbi:immunoglobulin-like domain-containing protein [Saccharothrix texasensis]|uniref:immunoglobulin-like domain-containing protein n=1 Tax=Saccharothrix texasensis TaxID=103734 RepID=UPI003CCC8C69
MAGVRLSGGRGRCRITRVIGRSQYAADKRIKGQVRDFRLDDRALPAADVAALALDAALALPSSGAHGSAVAWASSDPAVCSPPTRCSRPRRTSPSTSGAG